MAEERVQRRLAAILAADVVGYSRLMGEDETGTLNALKQHRAALIDPTIAEHRGRIVKLMGDGVLVEFASVVDAVECAVSIQRGMIERNVGTPDNKRITFRIGVNLGDIIIDDDDIYGDGVNVAARLEGLAEPGGICVSEKVFSEVRTKLEIDFDDLGPQQVKNIAEPVRAYRVTLDRGPVAPKTAPLSLPDKPSIAVLPFDNMSGDPEQEYFSDGLAEDLITDLSKISGLFVIARNSAFAFKEQTIDVKEVAEKLGVKHILEGSVRKAGGKVRINAQLIDAASGGHIWADRYDGDLEDIFSLQDNITAQIVAALQVSLTPTDQALAERKPTDSVEAYDLFLKGRANFYRLAPDHMLEAIKCLEEAIERDPNFAEAYSLLSYCHLWGWAATFSGSDGNLDRANELAERGVALDETSAIAVMRLAWTQLFLRRFDEAIGNFEKALAMSPDKAEVCAMFGQALNYWGSPERGLQLTEKAFSIEKVVPPSWEFQLGLSHLLLRQHDQAIARFNRAIERAPKITPAHLHLACAYVELGRLDDARGAIKTVLEITAQFTLNVGANKYPYRTDEAHNRFLDNLRKAGVPEG